MSIIQSKYQQGIILISILLFMQIFMMIGIFVLQNSFLMQMIAHGYNKKEKRTKNYEEMLLNAEQSFFSQCMIKTMDRQDLISKSIDWWLKTGCQGTLNNYQYAFVVESLEEDACAYQNTPEPDLSAYYFRITVFIFSDKNSDEKQILQSTIIKIDNARHSCTEKFHQIVPGRQMWRILI